MDFEGWIVPLDARGTNNKKPGATGLSRAHRPESHPSRLPVTGAWQVGDPVGNRRFHHRNADRPFATESGGVFHSLDLAYETWGTLNANASNAVLICHALTGDSHVAGPSGRGHAVAGWWDDLVGPGKAIDTDEWFVVCVNVLGGCQGSTGPSSINPATGQPYGSTFPVVTIRDIVRSQALVADSLGINAWASVIGGSMGGMQALEWAIMFPQRLRSMATLASTAYASAQQIAWSHVGRLAIGNDPNWRDGDYYQAENGDGPHKGLALARAIAQIHYRSEVVYAKRFGRRSIESIDDFGLWNRFEVEGYLDYHGEKLVRRFDANSYLVLNKSMDLHDIGRGRTNLERALERIQVPVLTMSIDSDGLYPPYQQTYLAEVLNRNGMLFEHVSIRSDHGHDGFLVEPDQVGPPLTRLLNKVAANE